MIGATETINKDLILRFVKDNNSPLTDMMFRLEVTGLFFTGKLDDNGYLRVSVPAGAAGGTLVFLRHDIEGREIELWRLTLTFAAMDDATSEKGAQMRLSNLGLYPGREDGMMDDRSIRAVERFQKLEHIEPVTGELDDVTVKSLQLRYGS